MPRIHIIVDDADKARYALLARRQGKSLGAWLREAAEEKANAAATRTRIDSAEDLRRFFRACDSRETNPEPEWTEHLKVVGRSRTTGLDVT